MRATILLLAISSAAVASPEPLKLDRFVGLTSHDMMLAPPPGLSANAETVIEHLRDEGAVFAFTGDKQEHPVIVLDRFRKDGERMLYTIEDLVEVPATTTFADVTTACGPKPTIAILAAADRCTSKPRKALHAWRIVGHKLLVEKKAAVACTQKCSAPMDLQDLEKSMSTPLGKLPSAR